MRRLRLGNEDGIALVMALGVMMVLSIVLVSVISYSSATARHSGRTKAGQSAYALAEAGLNNALGQLGKKYPLGLSSPPPLTGDSSLPNPSGTASYSGGTVTWTATWTSTDAYRGTWKITSTSTVTNPTGPSSSSVSRTIKADVPVFEHPRTVGNLPQVWEYVYSGRTGNVCDMTIGQSVNFEAPLYVKGNLCVEQSATVIQPTKFVAVGGNVTIANQGGIGQSSPNKPIAEVHVVGTCQYKNNAVANPCVTGDTTQVYATAFDHTMPSPPSVPTGFWTDAYTRAAPGPNDPCHTSTSDTALLSVLPAGAVSGVYNLTPDGTSYTCKAKNGGELSWNGTTHVLTVNGDIYIDASVEVNMGNNVYAHYSGSANIYVAGTVNFKNNSILCAKLASSGTTCDWSGWKPGSPDNILLFISNGDGQGQVSSGQSVEFYQSKFQGGVYGTKEVHIEQSSEVQGPLVSPNDVKPTQSALIEYPSVFTQFEGGAPGDRNDPEFTFGPAEHVTY